MDPRGWISFASRFVVGRHGVLRVNYGTNVGPMGPMIDGEQHHEHLNLHAVVQVYCYFLGTFFI